MRLSQYKQALTFVPVSLVKRATDYARKALKQMRPLVYDAKLQDSKGTKTNLRWLSATPSFVLYDSIENMERVHGHNGNTTIIWKD